NGIGGVETVGGFARLESRAAIGASDRAGGAYQRRGCRKVVVGRRRGRREGVGNENVVQIPPFIFNRFIRDKNELEIPRRAKEGIQAQGDLCPGGECPVGCPHDGIIDQHLHIIVI